MDRVEPYDPALLCQTLYNRKNVRVSPSAIMYWHTPNCSPQPVSVISLFSGRPRVCIELYVDVDDFDVDMVVILYRIIIIIIIIIHHHHYHHHHPHYCQERRGIERCALSLCPPKNAVAPQVSICVFGRTSNVRVIVLQRGTGQPEDNDSLRDSSCRTYCRWASSRAVLETSLLSRDKRKLSFTAAELHRKRCNADNRPGNSDCYSCAYAPTPQRQHGQGPPTAAVLRFESEATSTAAAAPPAAAAAALQQAHDSSSSISSSSISGEAATFSQQHQQHGSVPPNAGTMR